MFRNTNMTRNTTITNIILMVTNNQGESGDNHTHGHAGHDHHCMMIEDFKRRFWISLFFTLPVLVLSPMIQGFFGFEWIFNENT